MVAIYICCAFSFVAFVYCRFWRINRCI